LWSAPVLLAAGGGNAGTVAHTTRYTSIAGGLFVLGAFFVAQWLLRRDERRSPFVRAAAGATIALLALATRLFAALSWSVAPSLREMGIGGYPIVLFAVAGAALAVTDAATAGRHPLLPLVRVLATASLGYGLTTTLAGATRVCRALTEPDAIADAARWRETAAVGSSEAQGCALAGTTMAVLVLVLGEVSMAYRSLVRSGPPRG
jgi:hypothetical protein